MKRTKIIFLLLAASFVACSRRDSISFVLQGNVWNAPDATILVTGMDSRFDRVDTILTHADGSFSYSCALDTVTPLFILYTDRSYDVVFADKGLTCTLTRDSASRYATVTGGEWNEQYARFIKESANDSTHAQIVNRIDSFIEVNSFSEVTPYLLYRYFLQAGNLNRSRLLSLIEKTSGQMQDNVFITVLKSQLGTNRRQPTILDNKTVSDTALVLTKLGDLCKEGHLLLCFWASWDSVSRNVHKGLAGLQQKHDNDLFDIAGISIDTESNRWRRALDEDSLTWRQFTDLNGWSSPIIGQMGIERLPYFILIDQNLRIIAYGSGIDDIEGKLETSLKPKPKPKKVQGRQLPQP